MFITWKDLSRQEFCDELPTVNTRGSGICVDPGLESGFQYVPNILNIKVSMNIWKLVKKVNFLCVYNKHTAYCNELYYQCPTRSLLFLIRLDHHSVTYDNVFLWMRFFHESCFAFSVHTASDRSTNFLMHREYTFRQNVSF